MFYDDYIHRRKRDTLSRLSRRNNLQLKSRSSRAQHRRRYHKPRAIRPVATQLIREDPMEPLETVSGYPIAMLQYLFLE